MDAGHPTSVGSRCRAHLRRIASVSGSQASVGLPLESIDPVANASIRRQIPAHQRAKSLLVGMVAE